MVYTASLSLFNGRVHNGDPCEAKGAYTTSEGRCSDEALSIANTMAGKDQAVPIQVTGRRHTRYTLANQCIVSATQSVPVANAKRGSGAATV